MQKKLYIDSVRGLAIVGVLLVHCYNQFEKEALNPHVESFLMNGAYGVQLFYITSALTLFMSQARRKKERNPNLNFIIRRFFRIAPLFYLAILYYLWDFGPGNFSTANIVSHFLFVHGVSPYWINSLVFGGWSIGVEMPFYCLVPYLFRTLNSANKAVAFTITSMLVAIGFDHLLLHVNPVADSYMMENFRYYNLINQLPIFGFGFILYYYIDTQQRPSSTLLAIAVVLYLLLKSTMLVGDYIGVGVGLSLLVYALSFQSKSLLVDTRLAFLGQISFSLYLCHFAVIRLLNYLGWSTLPFNPYVNYGLKFFAVLTLSTVVAYILYRLIELPGQTLGKRIIARLDKGESFAHKKTRQGEPEIVDKLGEQP